MWCNDAVLGRGAHAHTASTYLGEFEQLVLFAVLRLDEASGIAIHDEIEARTGRDVSPGAIYTTLGRLEDRGFVTSEVRTPEPGRVGRPRKHYTLRPAGARALRDAYASLQALAGGLGSKLAQIARS
jgi:PadR family transcriptional regulator, regulatory protein PadR